MSQSGTYFTNNGPGGFVQTLTGNVGPAVVPTAGNINVVGTGAITTTGAGSTLTISFGGSVAQQFDADVGSAVPAANIIIMAGGTNMNTSAAGNTVTYNLNDNVTLLGFLNAGTTVTAGTGLTVTTGNAVISAGNVNITAGNLNLPNTNGAGTQGEIIFGGSRFVSNFGGTNTFVGAASGNTTLTGFSNAGFGSNSLQSLTTGPFNVGVGFFSGASLTAGTNNVAVGAGSLGSATGAGTDQNTAVGSGALNTATGPVNNIAIGYLAASNYTTNESNNILIGNTGTVADSARIRIGQNGTQTSAFISGIYGVNVGSVATIVSIINTDQLGQTAIVAGSGITVTPGANTITISSTGADLLTYTNVNTTPYVVLSTDEYLSVDTSALSITVQLPNAPSTGRVFYIKDRSGAAFTRNISVTTVGGIVTIDTVTTYTINTNFAAISLIFNGSAYEIF